VQRPDESRELPSDLQLGPVCILVSDLSRSLLFYGELLGLQAHRRADGTAVLGSIGGGHPLVELRERPDIAPAPEGGRPGLYHFALLLPSRGELGRFVRHLAGRGIPIGAADHAVSEAVYLKDPDGLGIEVYADRPAEEWEYHRGQLRMGTRPLDLGALVSDAGPGEWEGFPHDTRMGHLHLHVADLDRAAEFYEEALGLSRTVWNYPGALFLAAGGYHHHLGTQHLGHPNGVSRRRRGPTPPLVAPAVPARGPRGGPPQVRGIGVFARHDFRRHRDPGPLEDRAEDRPFGGGRTGRLQVERRSWKRAHRPFAAVNTCRSLSRSRSSGAPNPAASNHSACSSMV
jgi:catechol 2,3-dioxygenase